MIRITIYNEFYHEQTEEAIKKVYPNGIHSALKSCLESDEISVRCYTLDTVNDITDEVLTDTDVMIWWGHMKHREVPDCVAERVSNAVRDGMGIIFLHSAHESKPFSLLLGTGCHLNWREDGDKERIWTIMPSHPIAKNVPPCIVLPNEETYSEPFGIPQPDDIVFIGWYSGGEVFRSGCTFHRENGKIFYFQPGHESFPIYYNPDVQQVIKNAVYWVAPSYRSNAWSTSHHVTCPENEE